jgi:hypothetical protein
VEISGLWPGVLTRSVVNFSSGTEIPTRPRKLMEKPGQKLVIFACEWELRKGHYDVLALFKFRSERWNGMYHSAAGRTRNLNSRRAHVQATSMPLTLPHLLKCTDVISARTESWFTIINLTKWIITLNSNKKL